MKGYPYMKNAIVFLYNYFARLLRNLSPLHTDLARSSVLYLWDRKIKKNPNPFPIWKIQFGLYWFGVGNRTGFSRLAAARSAPLSGHTVAWFTTASSSPVFALIFLWSKIKTSVLTEVLIWYGRWNQIRIESVCFCDLFSTDFTRWSLPASLYYGRGQQTGISICVAMSLHNLFLR